MTYHECISLINQLNHADKLRLAQWLIRQIALDEGIPDVNQIENTNKTGLCGIWQDSRSSDEISQEIINNRSNSRDISW